MSLLMVFFSRDLMSRLNDSQYVLIALLEAPVLAALLSFIIKSSNNTDQEYTFSMNENVPAYIFMLIIVALFVGLTISAEEKGLDGGDGKGNLEINYGKHVYKCWSCGETHGTHGPLGKLFDQYATKSQKKVYNLIKPEELKQEDIKRPKLRLPEGYTTFQDSNPRFIPHMEAYRYLQSRGITDEMIERFKIGYTVSGDFAYRIIVPSFNKEGVLNYLKCAR